MDEVETFFCQFPNPWALSVSGMGGYTSKCEKKSKSLHPNGYVYRVNYWCLSRALLSNRFGKS